MKNFLFFCFIQFLTYSICAQNNNQLNSYKAINIYSKHQENSKNKTPIYYPKIDQQIKKYDIYSIDSKRFFDNISQKSASKIKHFQFVLGEKKFDFTIWPANLRASNYVLRTGDDKTSHTLKPVEACWYKGYVNNNPKNKVRINIRNNHIEGVINEDNNTYGIQSLSVFDATDKSNSIVFYNMIDFIEIEGVACGVEHDNILKNYNTVKKEPQGKTIFMCTEIALACDYSFRQLAGGTSQAETRLTDIFNFVQGNYEDLEIDYQIVEIFVSSNTNNDTWGNHADGGAFLDNFTNWAGSGFSQSHDLGSVYTGTNFSNNVIGLAWIAGTCNNLRYSLVEYFSGFGNNLVIHAIDQTHELGHNWSSNHDTPSEGNPSCVTCYMSPSLSGGEVMWSSQSTASIKGFRNNANCLTEGKCIIVDPPVINFFANNTEDCGPEYTVYFSDYSVNSPFEWLWDFGDGNTSTEQNPTHTYLDTGVYSVTLTATNQIGTSVDTRDQFITIRTGEPDSTIKGGPVDNTIFSGGRNNNDNRRGLLFDVLSPCILQSVKVYAQGTAERTIEVLNNENTTVHLRTVTIPDGESRVMLNLDLIAGNGYFIKISDTDANLYRSIGSTNYPYSVGNLISITNSDAGDNFYFFFYDWEVREKGCTPIPVINNPDTTISSSEFQLYPNPTTDKLNIIFPQDIENKNIRLSIYNNLGKIIRDETTGDLPLSNIDMSNLTAGVYFLKITDNQNNETTFKLVKH